MSGPVLRLRGRNLVVESTLVMGVVNASPESFSDAGRYDSWDAQRSLIDSLVESGADVLDVGGQSAITNQPEIDAALEVERVLPIVEWIRSTHPGVLVSVDTYKPPVVSAVLEAGAHIINDVSGLLYPEVADMCAAVDAGLVVMHTKARPKQRMQSVDLYSDVVTEVEDFLVDMMQRAQAHGVDRDCLILDPGPDFAKTPRQTLDVLRNVERFQALGRPLLLALSRKDFLGAITGRTPRGRGPATDAALAFFAWTPGAIVRVHDVRAARDVIAVVDALAGRLDIPHDYLLPDELRHEPRAT